MIYQKDHNLNQIMEQGLYGDKDQHDEGMGHISDCLRSEDMTTCREVMKKEHEYRVIYKLCSYL